MLRSLDHMLGYRIVCLNGDIGTVEDFFLVDDAWTVRYLVVAAGGWLDRKQVLVSPESVQRVTDVKREIEVRLTRELVYCSPDIDTDKPVSRQKEILLAEHYGWKPYWTPDPLLGVNRIEIDKVLPGADPHLRSFREISKYAVTGGMPVGFVADLIVDDSCWQITGIVTSKERTRIGRTVLMPPHWVLQIDWTKRAICVDANEATMNNLPAFNFSTAVNTCVFLHHFDYHGRLHHISIAPPGKKTTPGMKRLLENILGDQVLATDGEIGRIHDFLFDDSLWRVRYLVIETGTWLNRKRVLVVPESAKRIVDALGQIVINLSRAQVQSSPDVDTDKPVSRQQEILMNAHYGWPAYWSSESLLIAGPVGAELRADQLPAMGDPHLRSFREVSSYDLKCGDCLIAKVQDVIVNDQDWSVKGVIVSRGGWLDSRQAELPTSALTGVSWKNQALTTELSIHDIEALPAFHVSNTINTDARTVYFDYYGRLSGDMSIDRVSSPAGADSVSMRS